MNKVIFLLIASVFWACKTTDRNVDSNRTSSVAQMNKCEKPDHIQLNSWDIGEQRWQKICLLTTDNVCNFDGFYLSMGTYFRVEPASQASCLYYNARPDILSLISNEIGEQKIHQCDSLHFKSEEQLACIFNQEETFITLKEK